MVVRTISYKATAASEVDAAILQAVATILDLDLTFATTTTSTGAVGDSASAVATTTTLEISCYNAYTNMETKLQAVSLTGCVRLLASAVPELAVTPEMESWLSATEQTILPPVRSGKQKEDFFQTAMAEFGNKVETRLADRCVLVGEAFSLADLVVALSFFHAQTIVPDTVTDKWMKACLMQLQKCGVTIPVVLATATAVPSAAVGAAAAAAIPSSDNNDDNAVLAALQMHKIEHILHEHVACMTAEELVANVPIGHNETHTKNLFLKDKKHGMYLVTVVADAVVQTKDLGKLLHLAGKTNFRLADATVLDAVLHVAPGCVGPLAMVNASEPVTLVLDAGLKKFAMIHSHPLRNDRSVALTLDAFETVLQKMNVTPIWLDFGAAPPAEATAAAAPAATTTTAPKDKKVAVPKEAGGGGAAVTVNKDKKTGKKGETLLALQWKKSENFPMWYSDVIVLSEMISYYDISGCYILRPWSYKMWELIQEWFNGEIQKLGVENSYFPMFVSQDRLEKEKDHVEGFAPEVAWVTRSGDGELAKPIAVRPTSETIMYPAYSDWIKSHRDLPLKLNQWNNVVRWEFKYPTPFLRTREFLWQEGHTAHATDKEAEEMVMKALDLYKQVYEGMLAVPVVPGYKTEKEKFAGGYRTTTVEAYVAGSGRAIQGATSHHLGQNFGKMFDITFQDDKGETQTAWQTSWGLTTRTIGVMVMVHGDDTGLVLPPRVAPLQAVIVPIYSKNFTSDAADPYCEAILQDLVANGIRAKYDSRQMYNPGWKYNHWEQKGVPIRIEVGPRDVTNQSARIVYRYNSEKKDLSVAGLGVAMVAALVDIQANMLKTATAARDAHLVTITDWKDFVPNLEKNNLVLTPWIGGEHTDWEEWVKKKSREEALANLGLDAEDEKTATSVAAKTLCIPFDQPILPAGTKCIASGEDATCWILWGRSY